MTGYRSRLGCPLSRTVRLGTQSLQGHPHRSWQGESLRGVTCTGHDGGSHSRVTCTGLGRGSHSRVICTGHGRSRSRGTHTGRGRGSRSRSTHTGRGRVSRSRVTCTGRGGGSHSEVTRTGHGRGSRSRVTCTGLDRTSRQEGQWNSGVGSRRVDRHGQSEGRTGSVLRAEDGVCQTETENRRSEGPSTSRLTEGSLRSFVEQSESWSRSDPPERVFVSVTHWTGGLWVF